MKLKVRCNTNIILYNIKKISFLNKKIFITKEYKLYLGNLVLQFFFIYMPIRLFIKIHYIKRMQ